MLDKEAQQALVALMQTKQNLEDQVLKSLRNPDLTTEQLIKLRKKYLGFLEKLQEIEDEIHARQQGSPEEWMAMWKGQKDD